MTMKAPRLAYQSAHHSFVPSVSSARQQPRVDTLTSMCDHRLAPSQCRRPKKKQPKKQPMKEIYTEVKKKEPLGTILETSAVAAVAATVAPLPKKNPLSTNVHETKHCPHNLVQASQRGMSSTSLSISGGSNIPYPAPTRSKEEAHHPRRSSFARIVHHLLHLHHPHHEHGESRSQKNTVGLGAPRTTVGAGAA